MKKGHIALVAVGFGLLGTTVVVGQTVSRTELDSNGNKYVVTENTWQQTTPYTDYETRTESLLQPQTTTQVQTIQQTYAVPVTEYRMVSRLRGWWNPFTSPYWTHEMRPVTRWSYQSAAVQIPVSRTDWVAGTRTVQVPVTKYRTENKTLISRVPIGGASSSENIDTLSPQSSTPMVASRTTDSRYGSQRMTSDLPRGPAQLR